MKKKQSKKLLNTWERQVWWPKLETELLSWGFNRRQRQAIGFYVLPVAKDVIDEVQNLITAEILIAQKENKPTSRLISLAVKVGGMKK